MLKLNRLLFQFSLLKSHIDSYGCLHIDNISPIETDLYNQLNIILEKCKSDKLTGIWLRLYKQQLQYAQIISDIGFDIHHCKQDYLQFSKWLQDDESRLPNFASHIVNVKFLVSNSENQLPQEIVNDNQLIPEMAQKYFDNKKIKIYGQYSENNEINLLVGEENTKFNIPKEFKGGIYEVNQFEKYIIYKKQ